MRFGSKFVLGAGVALLSGAALANLKVADTPANLGTTAAEKTPKGVLDIVGNTDGSGKTLPSLIIRNAAADTQPLLQVSSTCSASFVGSVRYLPGTGAEKGSLVYCDGTNWVSSSSNPPAQIAFFYRTSCPTGWLAANGATVNVADYADLASALGASAATTFKLPDLRGEFIRGWDAGRGADPDSSTRTVGSLQSFAIQNITGTFDGNTDDDFAGIKQGAFYTSQRGGGTGANGDRAGDAGGTVAFDASKVVQTSTETRPRNVALLACIKT
jgi:phage-related tail fiber protein